MQADAIDPQAKAAMERQERFPIPNSRLGLKLARLLTRPVMWYQNRDNPAVGRTIDRSIPGPAGDIDVRLYHPEGDGPFPTIVFFHGGGYVLGSIGTHDWLCRHLTRESGCTVVSVDYRLAPEHRFPAAVEDAYAAVEWAAANPAETEGTGRLVVAGDSAGGTLAAVAGLMATERDGPSLEYQTLIYPGVGVEDEQPSVRENAGLVIDEDDMAFFRQCYFGSEETPRDPHADPMLAEDLSGLPPATVVTAGFDPLRDGGIAYAERLADAGVPVTHRQYDDMVHGFMTMREVDRAREAVASVGADIAEALGAEATSPDGQTA